MNSVEWTVLGADGRSPYFSISSTEDKSINIGVQIDVDGNAHMTWGGYAYRSIEFVEQFMDVFNEARGIMRKVKEGRLDMLLASVPMVAE